MIFLEKIVSFFLSFIFSKIISSNIVLFTSPIDKSSSFKKSIKLSFSMKSNNLYETKSILFPI
jgi:hypothetical protein